MTEENIKRLNAIKKEIKKVPYASDKWADLIIEYTAILNDKNPFELLNNLLKEMEQDLGPNSNNPDYLRGYLGGVNWTNAFYAQNFSKNLAVDQFHHLTKAVLVKKINLIKN